MSGLSQRNRRELKVLRRRIEHAQRQHAANLERALRRLPPELDDVAEQMLRLEPGAIVAWRHDEALIHAIARVFDALNLDACERRNGSEP